MTASGIDGSDGSAPRRTRLFSPISLKERESFYLQLGTILDSGVPIRDGLNTLAARAAGRGGDTLRELAAAVEAGATLSHAMGLHPEAFDPYTRALVRTGELVGRLDENLREAALACRRTREARNRMLTGLLYPLVLLHAAIVIPNLVVLVTKGFPAYLWATIPAILILWGISIAMWIGHSLLRDTTVLAGLRLKIPVLRKIALARFARSLSALYEGGLPLDEAVRMAGASTGNAILASDFRATAAKLSAGASLTPSLPPGSVLPPMLRDMIATGERTGRLGETLSKAAEFFEEEAETTIERICRILPVVAYLLIAGYIAVVILGFYWAYISQILSLF